MLHELFFVAPSFCIVARDCVYVTTKKHLQELNVTYSQLFTRPVLYSMINPLLHCAASDTVDRQCLPISISMSVNTILLSLQRN